MKTDLIVKEEEKEIGIYQRGGDGFFRYALRHITKPYLDGGTHQNHDLYRLHQLTLHQREGDGFSPVYDFPLTTNGEWECAMKIAGTPDFHGGFHGYERLTATGLDAAADRVFFWQESRILLQGTRDETVALHRKEYVFAEGGVTVKQRLLWERECRIDRAFLTMLPIRRREGDFLISDTARFDGRDYDISRAGHKTPVSPGCSLSGRRMEILGKESGIAACVTCDRERNFFVQNTEAYNKVYFFYVQNEATRKGDVWESESGYSFRYQK